jgi:prevent-host-death family protein
MRSVGVRELRQNASVLLDHVQQTGEEIEITNHGHPIARLTPIPTPTPSGRDALIASGRLRPGRGNPLDVRPVRAPRGTPSTDELLREDRGER